MVIVDHKERNDLRSVNYISPVPKSSEWLDRDQMQR